MFPDRWLMPTTHSQISRLFTLLHDGDIRSVLQSGSSASVSVACDYLTELLVPPCRLIVIRLFGVEDLHVDAWPRNAPERRHRIDDFSRLGDLEFEILSGDEVGEFVEVACALSPRNPDYAGGTLRLRAAEFQVVDELGTARSIDSLREASAAYWRRFGSR